MQNFLHPDCWPIGWAVFVPLLIHLWNRKEGRTILVGSIQWIPEQEQRKIKATQYQSNTRAIAAQSKNKSKPIAKTIAKQGNMKPKQSNMKAKQ